MNFTKINENFELLNADENQKKAIFALIDLKTEQNMKEVIMVIQNLESKMEARFDTLQSRLSTLEKLVWGLLYSFALTIVSTIIIAIVNKFF